MAKISTNIIILASAICFLSIINISYAKSDRFFIEGKVYCDTCRAQFITRISEYMAGAKVRMECKNISNSEITYTIEGETDKSGIYSLPVDGDHEEDICEVILVQSTNPECSDIDTDEFLRKSAKISVTSNNGVATPVRYANPLGFMRKEPLKECPEVLKELGITPAGLV